MSERLRESYISWTWETNDPNGMTCILNVHKISSAWLTVRMKWSVNQKRHVLLKTANTDRVCKQGYKTRVNLGVSCFVVWGGEGGESSGRGEAERDGPLTVSEASESGATSDLRLSERDRRTGGRAVSWSVSECPLSATSEAQGRDHWYITLFRCWWYDLWKRLETCMSLESTCIRGKRIYGTFTKEAIIYKDTCK